MNAMHAMTMLVLFAAGLSGLADEAGPPAPTLPLPAQVDMVAGRELNLWFDALWPAGAPPADITLESPVGTAGERSLRFVPDAGQAGRIFPATVRVRDRQGTLLAERAFKLRVLPAQNGGGRPLQLLLLGDSLTRPGITSGELLRLAQAAGLPNIRLLGRNDAKGENRHEGWGGWSFTSFATPGGSVYRFAVSGLAKAPDLFATYRHAEAVYRIQSRSLLPGADGLLAGNLLCSLRAADNKGLDLSTPPLPASGGVLAPVGHAGEPVAFAEVEYPVHANPFWDASLEDGKGGIHLRKYLRDHRFFGGDDRIDFVLVQLGVNDCYGAARRTTEAERSRALDSILEQCRTLVRALQDPERGYPDCRVILALTPIGCNSPAIYDRTYGDQGVTMALYESTVRAFWAQLIREFDRSPAWPGVRLAINGLVTDRDLGYPKREETVDGVTAQVHSNAVHPNEHGYRQCAEAYHAALCGGLADQQRP